MTLSPGDRVEIAYGHYADGYYPPGVRGTVSADRPPESGYPSDRPDQVWVELDSPVNGLKAAWAHIDDCRKLSILEVIAEAAQ